MKKSHLLSLLQDIDDFNSTKLSSFSKEKKEKKLPIVQFSTRSFLTTNSKLAAFFARRRRRRRQEPERNKVAYLHDEGHGMHVYVQL